MIGESGISCQFNKEPKQKQLTIDTDELISQLHDMERYAHSPYINYWDIGILADGISITGMIKPKTFVPMVEVAKIFPSLSPPVR